jgi:hypothetical protein
MKWLKYLTGILVILPILIMGSVAHADIPQPDSAPKVLDIKVFRNLLESRDTLFVIYADIPYAIIPTLSDNITTVMVDESYNWRLLDGSGNVVGTNTMYPYHNDGYGYNIVSLYFDNVTAISWAGSYSLQLIGTPPAFTSTTPSWSFNIPATAWDINADQTTNQTDLAGDVIGLSTKLDARWGNNVSTSLLTQGDTGSILSLAGQYFWNGAIQGLQGMAPTAYLIVIGNINTTPTTWSDNYSVALSSQWNADNFTSSWLPAAQQGGADMFGTGWDLLSVILTFVIAIAIAVGNVALTHDGWNAMLDVSVWVVFAARLGLYGFAFLGLLAAIAVIFIALKLWGVRG